MQINSLNVKTKNHLLCQRNTLNKKIRIQTSPPISRSHKQAGTTTLTADKEDTKRKLLRRGKVGCLKRLVGNIHQEDITIVSICAQNTRTPSFINQTLKGVNNHTSSNTK